MLYPDDVLLQVEKPARYIGREIHSVTKDPNQVDIRFAFCFPDAYEVGMSHLGLQIMYFYLNRRKDTYCERVFSPWIDMEEMMIKRDLPLVTLESYDEVKNFDFLGFTLQYEMCYTNVLQVLSLSKIPLLAAQRGEDSPLVCGGGPCAYNPEPLADFFDFFYIGEGEEKIDEILDLYKEFRQNGGKKRDFLALLLSVQGVYVPQFYNVCYNADGTIASFLPNHKNAPTTISKVLVKDMDGVFYPQKQLVPLMETVHDRVTLELFRGCLRGCRFCQAGFVYRPVREKRHETLLEQAKNLVAASGHEEISLVSLSTSDYSHFKELSYGLVECFEEQKVNISLPSLRIDAFNLDIMQKVQGARKGGLTFAPEAGTQRLRNVINKNLTETDILGGVSLAFSGGWERLKLYFMVGLPTETQEDLQGIVDLVESIVGEYYRLPKENRGRPVGVSVSTGCFVPKPFTPFQWACQDTMETFMEKQYGLKSRFATTRSKKQIKYTYHNADISLLEGLMARGDRRLGKTILQAFLLGARFDGWSEHFRFSLWQEAILQSGVSLSFYTTRKRDYNEILPWDFIDIGVTKAFLKAENEKALQENTTPDCKTHCSACGVAKFGGGVCAQ